MNETDYVQGTTNVSGLNQAADLGEWVRAQIASGEHTNDHTTRVITQETDRWFKNGLTIAQIAALCAAPVDTGDPKWDALIEGVVARRLHEAGMNAPEWTRRTNLTDAWGPYEHQARDINGWMMMVLSTPAELLDKGIVLPRGALARI